MSDLPNRRSHGVNMSQYIQNLNEVRKDSPPEENMASLEEELAMFTNTSFTDWDASNSQGSSPANNASKRRKASATPATTVTRTGNTAPPPGPMPTADAMGDVENFEFHLGQSCFSRFFFSFLFLGRGRISQVSMLTTNI